MSWGTQPRSIYLSHMASDDLPIRGVGNNAPNAALRRRVWPRLHRVTLEGEEPIPGCCVLVVGERRRFAERFKVELHGRVARM